MISLKDGPSGLFSCPPFLPFGLLQQQKQVIPKINKQTPKIIKNTNGIIEQVSLTVHK